ncbi:MAG: selenide, water dikinase SelD [Ignavibacteria bacterium]|nr:selenide, water dikinase SelD [Ignavibacteria bacterium]
MSEIRLTQMVKSAGCAAKLFPYLLSDILKDINWGTDKNVLVDFSGKDDAGVYKISDELALIHTTDFFTPVVDDPYTFGQIAATNSLSDVYAMGGIPLNALNIIAFPQKEDLNILKEILKGGNDKAKEAECIIIGGHSVDIENILYGLAVTGKINPENIIPNNQSKKGDILILTKGLGTGVLNNAVKYRRLDNVYYKNLIETMTRLNKTASELMIRHKANSCTDITGFGFAGHSMQMAAESKKIFIIKVNNIPVIEGAKWAISEKLLTRGDKSNRIYTKDMVLSRGRIETTLEHLLYDPQTSGGLLISVPESNAEKLLKDLIENGDTHSKIIGMVEEPTEDYKPGTLIFDYDD